MFTIASRLRIAELLAGHQIIKWQKGTVELLVGCRLPGSLGGGYVASGRRLGVGGSRGIDSKGIITTVVGELRRGTKGPYETT